MGFGLAERTDFPRPPALERWKKDLTLELNHVLPRRADWTTGH